MLQAANKLDGVVEIVTSASEELSAQIEQSSRGSEDQSRRVTETATAMEEMNATVLEVAKSASNAAQSAEQAKTKAEDGARVVSQVVKGIQEVHQQSQAMKEDMDSLASKLKASARSQCHFRHRRSDKPPGLERGHRGCPGRRGRTRLRCRGRRGPQAGRKDHDRDEEVAKRSAASRPARRRTSRTSNGPAIKIVEATKLANTSGESLQEIVNLVESTTDLVRSIATASEEQLRPARRSTAASRTSAASPPRLRRHAPIRPGRGGAGEPVDDPAHPHPGDAGRSRNRVTPPQARAKGHFLGLRRLHLRNLDGPVACGGAVLLQHSIR